MTTLPKITNKQETILKLLYRHRFLSRIQIQQFLGHKDKVRTSIWLKDLTEKQYVGRIYDPHDFTAKTKPAIYYLGINGIRYLRGLGSYSPEEVRKRYTESKRKQTFIDTCLLLADCCIHATTRSTTGVTFTCILSADYADPDDTYNFLEELRPNACFVKEDTRNGSTEATNYLLDVFIATPRHRIKGRIREYIEFLNKAEWEDATNDEEPPVIELAFSTKLDLIYAKRRVKLELASTYGEDDDDIPEDISVQFTTIEQIREQGVTAKIWERLR